MIVSRHAQSIHCFSRPVALSRGVAASSQMVKAGRFKLGHLLIRS